MKEENLLLPWPWVFRYLPSITPVFTLASGRLSEELRDFIHFMVIRAEREEKVNIIGMKTMACPLELASQALDFIIRKGIGKTFSAAADCCEKTHLTSLTDKTWQRPEK